MASRWCLAGCGSFVLLVACAITRQGTLTKLPAGPEIPVTVAVSETEATVMGTDPQSGEEFSGTFHLEETKGDRGMLGAGQPVGGGSVTPGVAPLPMTGTKGTIVMSGRLEGDKGTSLKCMVQIERTLTLKGSGTCLLADTGDLNPAYHLRF